MNMNKLRALYEDVRQAAELTEMATKAGTASNRAQAILNVANMLKKQPGWDVRILGLQFNGKALVPWSKTGTAYNKIVKLTREAIEAAGVAPGVHPSRGNWKEDEQASTAFNLAGKKSQIVVYMERDSETGKGEFSVFSEINEQLPNRPAKPMGTQMGMFGEAKLTPEQRRNLTPEQKRNRAASRRLGRPLKIKIDKEDLLYDLRMAKQGVFPAMYGRELEKEGLITVKMAYGMPTKITERGLLVLQHPDEFV